ncbi:MAG TPA: FtsW/RodA/SpoVE family cell cycle protein, partial [Candidatus Eisenbacteria bacterium]|nr:FtsW/RodA/SpoVE family cell cycle protein [Candidatus Eisenbacteria bacterium]
MAVIGRSGGQPAAGRLGGAGRAVPAGAPTAAERKRATAARPPARAKANVLRRDRHQPEYMILVAVVTLAAIGILMVYSSSAIRAYISRDDAFAIVGPQIVWAAIGLLAMAVMMRLDYRLLRLASVPFFAAAVALLVLVFEPSLNRVVGGSARWLVLGPLPAIHPAEIAKLALTVYLAHWLASRGTRISGFRSGTLPFLLITV